MDDPSCLSTVSAYGKILDKRLTPAWWAAPADAIEACRIRGKTGALAGSEADAFDTGYGATVQGTDRVRLLVQGDVCGQAGMSNVILAVRGDHGVTVTPVFFSYNQGGQEAPFALDVVTTGGGTYALFSAASHDINTAYSGTDVYKIDFATGAAVPYALYRTAAGDTANFGTSEPIGIDLDDSHTAQIAGGHFVAHFIAYDANTCDDGDAKCQPVTKTGYSWNGAQFVVDGYDAAHKAYLGKLAAQRACLAHGFDTKRGVSNCDITAAECEGNNDLSLLAYKAHLRDRAKDYAADALEFCRGRAKDMAAAAFNYARAVRGE
jgi:hypothetical protein